MFLFYSDMNETQITIKIKSKKIYFRTKIDILKQSACNLIRVLICCNYRAKLYEGCTTKKEIYETI